MRRPTWSTDRNTVSNMPAAELGLRLYQATGEQTYLDGIYFKNLLLLESVAGGSQYRKAAQSYADDVWATHRDPQTGLFHFGSDHTQTLEQAAMIQIYAVLSWPHSQWGLLY